MNVKSYLSFFKIKFINGLQYRTAAYAGVITQLAWGFMYIMMYEAFYKSNPAAASMKLPSLVSYIWLQQAFLALFMTWFVDNDILELITSGNVAYELVRPISLYDTWFSKSCANRVAKAVLRCFPIIIVSLLIPKPYSLSLPYSFKSFILFLISMILALVVIVSYNMFIYILSFYTVSPIGLKIVFTTTADFLAGGVVPIPLLPDNLVKIINLTPFAYMQNTPFRIYSGDISAEKALTVILIQFFWAVVLVSFGKLLMGRTLKKVVVQGG